eukprot:4782569-Amphidinium_carterae.2
MPTESHSGASMIPHCTSITPSVPVARMAVRWKRENVLLAASAQNYERSVVSRARECQQCRWLTQSVGMTSSGQE